MFHVKHFDVVVIGGGHAGCEAALASARMGTNTVLITMDKTKIAEMSCNPSIGGVGKGQLVKEIDALGGEMGINADYTGIQFKRLNTRKGSAVQSSRCQSDKKQYALRMQSVVNSQPNLTVYEGEVKKLLADSNGVQSVQVLSKEGIAEEFKTSNVVITAGTFMKGLIHCGYEQSSGGRFGEKPSVGLSDNLRELGFHILRLKTGTPARLLKGSIDFSVMERQPGDTVPYKFSFWKSEIPLPQVECFLAYTTPEMHEVIRANIHRSPLYSGHIQGIGPRYCPSIEDKIVKFPEKTRHHLFFEPEALDSDWIYPNGISTSLPSDVQEQFIRALPGCKDVQIARYGYAVEYDCVEPTQLFPSFESRKIPGLFFGGQVNGTSGYEEAAAQGLMAGINASLRVQKRKPLVLGRAESYIGVMADDLTSKGVTEPYRMFTSRAEYRLSLREDNADLRLSEYGKSIGLLTDENYTLLKERREKIETIRIFLAKNVLKPGPEIDAALKLDGSSPLSTPQHMEAVLRRPEVDLRTLLPFAKKPLSVELDEKTKETIEIEVKYSGYITIQQDEINRLNKLKLHDLPDSIDYKTIHGLTAEVREKLTKQRPKNLAEAAQISGITPAAITAVLSDMAKRKSGALNVEKTI